MKAKCLLIGVIVLFVAGVLTSSSYAKIDPKTIVGMWLFDEGKGDTAKDSSGNKNDGTLKNGPKWVDGLFSKALEFDGVGHYVDAGDPENGSLDFGTGDFTIGGWLKHNSTAVTRGVVNKRSHAALNNVGFQIQLQNGNKLHVYFCDGSADRLIGASSSVFADNSWHHFALVFDRDQKLTFYRDGITDGSLDISAQRGSVSNDRNFYIGAVDGGNPTLFFNGLIDDVAILRAVLTDDDIKNIMTNGLQKSILSAVDSVGKLTTTWATIKIR